jgi:hypothetical protein
MLCSGELCALTGFYRTTCICAETIELFARSQFPRCISCGEPVAWVYLQPLATSLAPVNRVEAIEVETHVRKLQACIRRESTTDPTLLFALGKALLRLGKIRPALEAIYGVLDHAPNNLSAHLELGRALLAFREPREAEKILGRGRQIARVMGDPEAAEEFTRLIELAQPGIERRIGPAAQRVPLDVMITRSDALDPGPYTAVNISETGLCITSPRQELRGSFVALDFVLGGDEIHAYAKVIWCRDLDRSRERPFSIGLQFLNLSASALERIRTYVRSQLR